MVSQCLGVYECVCVGVYECVCAGVTNSWSCEVAERWESAPGGLQREFCGSRGFAHTCSVTCVRR